MSLSAEHKSYLAQLGIAELPLTSSVAPNRRQRPSGRQKAAIGVFNENDLGKLRGLIFWRFPTDETREGNTVLVKRNGRVVARIDCGTEGLAWDAERIAAGVRFKRGCD